MSVKAITAYQSYAGSVDEVIYCLAQYFMVIFNNQDPATLQWYSNCPQQW